MEVNEKEGRISPSWDSGIECWPDRNEGYYIYNLKEVAKEVYEAMLIVKVNYPPDGMPENENRFWVAYQNVRAMKENGRWVVFAPEEFQYKELDDVYGSLEWGCSELPSTVYADTADDIRVEQKMQTVHEVDNTVQSTNDNWLIGSFSFFDTTAKPNAEFLTAYYNYESYCTHVGTQEERDQIRMIGISVVPVFADEELPEIMQEDYDTPYVSGSSNGTSSCSRAVEKGWGPTVFLGGGGSSGMENEILPEYYAVNLFLNGKLSYKMNLQLQNEGEVQ